jgi:hypothetical protein
MEGLMKALGKTIICMAKESIPGAMEGSMMENIIWIKNMVLASIIGLMGVVMKVTGEMENNMGRASIFFQMGSLK